MTARGQQAWPRLVASRSVQRATGPRCLAGGGRLGGLGAALRRDPAVRKAAPSPAGARPRPGKHLPESIASTHPRPRGREQPLEPTVGQETSGSNTSAQDPKQEGWGGHLNGPDREGRGPGPAQSDHHDQRPSGCS